MNSIANPATLASLISRLEALEPDTPRRWGTMTAGEMLCHLGDASKSILGRPGAGPKTRKRLVRWIALYSPLPWPKGAKTPPNVNPRVDGTRPGDFEADRQRAIEGLRTLAATPAEGYPAGHLLFGALSHADWLVWAFRHTDHHLRQFGV